MNPCSFLLNTEHLYYDKNKKAVRYVYVPSAYGCSGYDAFYEMAVEISKMITVSDAVLENKVLRAIIKGFNPIEFLHIIKDHVKGTDDLLNGVGGFEDIGRWASTHHEKLDGTGYHLGRDADGLDFVDRVLACTDIYQAVSEERPYHPRRSHEDTMPILWSMADKGFIDGEIVKDFDAVMAAFSGLDVPPPELFR